MSGTVFSGTYLSGITLNNPGTENPVTIGATGTISAASGTGLLGLSPTYWTVFNHGTISGKFAVHLLAGGYVVNDGSIFGGSIGVQLSSGGYVANKASISAVDAGIEIVGGLGTVVNSGTISNSKNDDAAVLLVAGGSVTNAASATISGVSYGVFILGATGTVVNSGTIASSKYAGVDLEAGGIVTNTASISGDYWGVAIAGDTGTVVNSGTISGSATMGSTITGVGVELRAGGYVTNAASGSISGGYNGIRISGGAGTVINSGAVSNNNTTFGAGVNLQSGGSATNTASGSISGSRYGIEIGGGSGAVVNSGTISDTGTAGGVGVYLKAGGFVTNNASGIINGHIGIEIGGGAGTLVNSGTVGTNDATLGTGVLLKSGGYVTNAAAASISGSADGIVISGSASIVNAGAIHGANTVVTGSLVSTPSGSVTSSITSSVTSSGGAAVSLSSSDHVTNTTSGLISGGKYGIEISGGSGGVFNTGTIDGLGATVTYSSTSSVTSTTSGNVTSTVSGQVTSFLGVAVSLASGGYVTNATSALISGGQYGVEIKGGSGTVINSGTIREANTASGAGIYLSNNAPFTNNASGLVMAAGSGVVLQAGGNVLNAGRIIGGTYGLEFTASGTVVNSGTISATNAKSGTGIDLKSGGTVTNQVHGLIRGTFYAIHAADTTTVTNAASASINGGNIGIDILANGTVLNAGSIVGDAGIYLKSGYISNASHAEIDGGVAFSTATATGVGTGTLVNAGAIKATYPVGPKYGVAFHQSGTLTNTLTGSITAHGYGVLLGNSGNVLNSGTIIGSSANTIGGGVYLKAGGSVANYASAVIKGHIGIDLLAGGTVTNAGTITGTGTGGKAIAFYGTASGEVIVDAGAVFTGAVVGSASASNTLELAAGGSGTLSGLGTSFVNFGTVTVDSGANWELTGANTLGANSTLTNSGTLTLSGATLSDAGGVINNGKIELDPSSMTVASLTGTGTVMIDAGSTLAVQGTISSGQHIVFNGVGAELDLDAPSLLGSTLSGFAAGDKIDLTKVANVTGSHADMDYATKVLTVTEAGTAYQFQFDKSEHFAGDFFHLASLNGGTVITEDQIACYCRGTRITTGSGEIPVEALAIGDAVMTASGALRPIKWIGRRSYGGLFVVGRRDVLPICVTAGSLADDLPRRDLWISPHHAMYLDGVLIEAKDLVNGVSIIQADHVERVEYFHIELDSHDLILAEGAASETFVDDDSRGMFHNAREYALLYRDQADRRTRYCAPRLDEGFAFETVRRRLALRAGQACDTRADLGPLRGFVDVVSAHAIEGWAQSSGHPEAAVCLDIYADGRLIGQTLANLYREDLEAAGIGNGRHAFVFTPDGASYSSARIEVRRSLDGAPLEQTARRLLAAAS